MKKILIKYSLILLNTFFSSCICILLFLIFDGMSLDNIFNKMDDGIIYLIMIGFIISIFPQIVLYIILIFVKKIIRINRIIDLIIVIILGYIITFVFLYNLFDSHISFKDFIIHGYSYYLPTITSGVIFRIVLYKINKINIIK